MRLVVTGRKGQVVRSLVERAPAECEIVTIGRPDVDLAGSPERVISAVERARPDVIVSAAAYTQVDKAESERDQSYAVNERGAAAVAQAASRLGLPLIHLSTDYVFDGSKASPYGEDDDVNPIGVYGASKLAGERAVLAEHDNCVILRTAWVYSPFGANFVKTMLYLAADRDEIGVVSDQRGNPTSALDIADGILAVATNLAADRDPTLRGVFHMAGAGEASWAEFAEAIFAVSANLNGPTARVRPISTSEYPTPAKRPGNSRLETSKLSRIHGVRLPDWRTSMKRVVTRLLQSRASGL